MLTGNGFMENEPKQKPEHQSERRPESEKAHESPVDNEQEGQLRKIGLLTVIVGDLIGCTGAGIGLGYLAWSKWHAPWWVLLLSSMAGLWLGFYRVYKLSQREF